MSGREERKADSALLSAYASKVQATLWETGARINWVLTVQSVLSLAIIAVATGLSPDPHTIPVGGVTLAVPFPLLLCGGALAVACLLMYQLGLVHHEEQLLRTAVGIYRSLGLDDPLLSDAVTNPLENPGIVTTIVALSLKRGRRGPAFWAVRAFAILLFLGLPLAAQVVVAYTLVVAGAGLWLIPLAVGFGLSTWHIILYAR